MKDILQTIGIFLTLAISSFSLIIVFKYRKKDFQLVILKEQLAAYRELSDMLFKQNKELKEAYSKHVDFTKIILNDEEYIKNVSILNLSFLATFEPYQTNYSKFQGMLHLLPEDIIAAVIDYYVYISDLFEGSENEYLGTALLLHLDQKCFEVVNVIRQHLGVDTISNSNQKILSAGLDQMKIDDEDNTEE
jgi:hypothetical protein